MSVDEHDAWWNGLNEQYEFDGYEPPPGHPDEWRADMERKELVQRYYDADWPRPVERVSDDFTDEELAA